MRVVNGISRQFGRWLAAYLNKPTRRYHRFSAYDPILLRDLLQPADVLLVEGNLRVSTAIKYMTQSTWSHAALFVGDAIGERTREGEPKLLIEADLQKGVIAIPLSKYQHLNVRICRPVGLTPDDQMKVVNFLVKSLGKAYDLRNVIDLARYLLPEPPIPARFRRRMLALGSGDPTRAICSTLIAQAFQSIHYPILPVLTRNPLDTEEAEMQYEIRHHSLFTPRDFDVSPYFEIVKPTLERGFHYQEFRWAHKRAPPPKGAQDT